MTQQPMEANVVLTADTSSYDAQINASADTTANLGTTIDSLTDKLDRLSKSAGRKLIQFSAADVAGITAATAAYGAFEQQMERLESRSAMLSRTVGDQQRTFREYTSSVNNLRGTFGTATSEAVQLVDTISRFSDNTRSVDRLATSFVKLGAATGESTTGLTQGMLQLQRTMGSTQRDTESLNNTLAGLSASGAASAQGILEFSQNIAPIGRMVNMTATDIMGVSKAFISAGQDGYQAANAFNKIVSDIAYATQSGSPDLEKYANLVGLTARQFKELGGTEQITRIFDELNRQGPQAITTLNRMGLDGMRTMRAITGMAQQSGGLGAAIAEARGVEPGTMGRGAEKALDGLMDSLKELRSELMMTAESFGSRFAKPVGGALVVVEKFSSAVRGLMQGPLGDLAAIFATVAAPIAAFTGVALSAAKAMATLSAASLALRGSHMAGFGAGRRGINQVDAEGRAVLPGGQLTDRPLNPMQRYLYNVGAGFGGAVGAPGPEGPNRYQQWLHRNTGGRLGAPSPAPGFFNRSAGWMMSGLGFGSRMIGDQFSPMWTSGGFVPGTEGQTDPSQRRRILNRANWSDYHPLAALRTGVGAVGDRIADTSVAGRLSNFGRQYEARATIRDFDMAQMPAFTASRNEELARKAIQPQLKHLDEFNRSLGETSKRTMSFGRGLGDATRGLGALAGSLSMSAAGTVRDVSKPVRGAVGSAAMGLFGGPWGLAAAGGIGALMLGDAMRDKTRYSYEDFSGSIAPYLQASGSTGVGGGAAGWQLPTARPARSAAAATTVNRTDVRIAQHSRHRVSNPQLKGLNEDETVAYIGTQFDLIANDPVALQQLKMDLIDKFGGPKAQNILNRLQRGGDQGGIGSFMQGAMNRPRTWGGLMPARQGDVAGRLNRALAVGEERANLAGNRYGNRGYYVERARSFGELLGGFAEHGPTQQMYGLGRTIAITPEERAMQDMLAGRFLGGKFREGDLRQGARSWTREGMSNEARVSEFLLANQERVDMPRLLDSLGLNPDLRGQKAIDAILERMDQDYTAGGRKRTPQQTLTQRVERAVPGAQGLFDTQAVATAFRRPEDINAQIRAVKDMLDSLRDAGRSAPQINQILGNVRGSVADPSDDRYRLAAAAQQYNQRYLQYQMPGMSRTERFGTQLGMFRSAMMVRGRDPEAEALRDQAQDAIAQSGEEQRQYFVGLLTQQREFNISRRRSEEDFALQRERMEESFNLSRQRAMQDFSISRRHAEEDYQRQRERAEYNYELQRSRQTANYWRGQRRQQREFNISRRRQERDHQHQVQLMVEAAAKSMLNIYERVSVQRTSSAEWMLGNAQEQLQVMERQANQLDRLRKMGLSDDVIQQLDLANPANAQQLERLFGGFVDNPKLVERFNRAIRQRLRAARELVTDESSSEWEEFNRQYRQARRRGLADFERMVRQSRRDFRRGMREMQADWNLSMQQQAEDYELGMNRQQRAFNRSMDRATEDYRIATNQMGDDFAKAMRRARDDINRSAKTINGDLADILEKSVNRLSGHARKQAQTVINQFDNLKEKTGPKAVALMEFLADVFGVDYTAPRRGGGGGRSGVGRGRNAGSSPASNPAARDTWNDRLRGGSGGGGGAKESRPATPIAGGRVTTPYGKAGSLWSSGYHTGDDYAAPAGTPILAALAGTIMSTGWHSAYGNLTKIAHGGGLETWYAHQSAFSKQKGDTVDRGDIIGRVGATGNTTGPHLHFEVRQNGSVVDPSSLGKMAQVAGKALKVSDVLSDYYPKLERLVSRLSGLNPFQDGDYSKVINRFARQAIRNMSEQTGMSFREASMMGDPGDGINPPANVKGNVALGKRMAAARGWTGKEWNALYKLWTEESGWRVGADNPGSSAYGIPQALVDYPGRRMPRNYFDTRSGSGASASFTGGDPRVQIGWGLNYIANAYGDPSNAWSKWQSRSPHWYAEGSIFNSPNTIGVGERGPEVVMPLDHRGVDFLASLMARMSVGHEAKQTNTNVHTQPMTVHNMHNYQIDRSTTFTGEITVKANNPNELITQLRNRERAAALTRPRGGRRVP